MINVKLMRFDQRPHNPKVWDVRYGIGNELLATINESVNTGTQPTFVVTFYRHVGGINSTPVVVPTREDAVRHIQKYFSGEYERYLDNEP